MPFDPHNAAPRPYMREGTAALAALVATNPARDVLTAIAAELSHRDRKAARMLAEQVAALLSVETIQPQPDAPAAPSYDPSLWPNGPPSIGIPDDEQRDDPQPIAPAPKPARKPASKRADKRPGDVGWKPPSLEALIKRVGNPAMMWDADASDYSGGNPMRKARIEALIAQGWVPGDDKPDGYMVMRKAGETLRIGHHGMIYMGLTGWWQMPRADRDALTDAGRPILARLARIAAAEAAVAAAKARRAQLVKHFPKHRAAARGASWAAHALLTAKAEARATWRALVKARADMATARAA